MYFSKELGRLSSAGPEIIAFGSQFPGKFQPIFDCFIPNFKLKYEDSENIKADRVNTVFFQFTSNQTEKRFGTSGRFFGSYPRNRKHMRDFQKNVHWLISQ